MLSPINNFFLNQPEPVKSYFQFLREYIPKKDPDITEAWKYGMPFYCFKGKMFCYLWIHKQFNQPYLGIVEGQRVDHPVLIIEKRARMKILLLDPVQDIPINKIDNILGQAIALYSRNS